MGKNVSRCFINFLIVGSLQNLLQGGKIFTENEFLYILKRIVKICATLQMDGLQINGQRNGLANSDIKPENIIEIMQKDKNLKIK